MIERRHFSGTGVRRLLAVAAMGATTLLGAATQAAPMPLVKSMATESHVLQVRDGCGRDMRYSERRGGCVEDFDGGPGYDRGPPGYDRRPPPPDYDRRPPPPPAYGGGPDYRGDPRAMPDCGRGMRFSNSRQACVRIEGALDDRGDNDVATGALIGGVVGGLVGSAIQNDANRGQR
jgi:hypothetical protein